MSNFELWLRGCEINDSLVYLLAERDGCKLLKVTGKFYINPHTYYDTPVYMVWKGDKNEIATTDYLTAYRCWENRREG